VAAVHEVGEDRGTIFVAMELVEGETLQERIAGRPLPLLVAFGIATEMADGLAAAHRAHVVHRDLKPANVVIRPDGHVKILDFGLAKLSQEARSGSSESSRLETEATREGRVLGTPAYMSPEQVRGSLSTPAPTSSPSAALCTRWSPASRRSGARAPPRR
jgi:serine/threonine-protein kinase